MQKPLEGGLGRWGGGLSPKCLGFAAMHVGVPSRAVEEQPPRTHSPRVPVGWCVAGPQGHGLGGCLVLVAKEKPGWASCRGDSGLGLAGGRVAEEMGG